MIFDGHVNQLPDSDPGETQEWLDSLDAVIDVHGKPRARFLLTKLLEKARESQVSFPPPSARRTSTPSRASPSRGFLATSSSSAASARSCAGTPR